MIFIPLFYYSLRYSIFLNFGLKIATIKAMSSVILPPKTTDLATPKILDATPLSNCPISLLDIINIELTLSTLPLILSGVFSWIIVPRITTEIPSNIPLSINIKKDIQ